MDFDDYLNELGPNLSNKVNRQNSKPIKVNCPEDDNEYSLDEIKIEMQKWGLEDEKANHVKPNSKISIIKSEYVNQNYPPLPSDFSSQYSREMTPLGLENIELGRGVVANIPLYDSINLGGTILQYDKFNMAESEVVNGFLTNPSILEQDIKGRYIITKDKAGHICVVNADAKYEINNQVNQVCNQVTVNSDNNNQVNVEKYMAGFNMPKIDEKSEYGSSMFRDEVRKSCGGVNSKW